MQGNFSTLSVIAYIAGRGQAERVKSKVQSAKITCSLRNSRKASALRSRRRRKVYLKRKFRRWYNTPAVRPIARPRYARIDLELPEVLDFNTHPEETSEFLMRFRAIMTSGQYRIIRMDHQRLRNLSADAALVLVAELYRGHHLQPGVRLYAKFPKNDKATVLLGEIGYYNYFHMEKWQRVNDRIFYLEHRRGEGVQSALAAELVRHWKSSCSLPASALYEALTEGMQNAAEWGYGNGTTGYRSWWLLGYRDVTTNEVAYCFYDQGATIPVTIRSRMLDKAPLIAPAGSALIQRAVQSPYSNTKSDRRGRGLPTLKRFVDQAAWGRLLIYSRESFYVHETGATDRLSDFKPKSHLLGTLISWNFRENNERQNDHVG